MTYTEKHINFPEYHTQNLLEIHTLEHKVRQARAKAQSDYGWCVWIAIIPRIAQQHPQLKSAVASSATNIDPSLAYGRIAIGPYRFDVTFNTCFGITVKPMSGWHKIPKGWKDITVPMAELTDIHP